MVTAVDQDGAMTCPFDGLGQFPLVLGGNP